MITRIAEAISSVLYLEYGCENYIENIEQGLNEPCFFIQSLNPTIKRYPGKRYFKQNPFCIQYFPKSRTNEEMYSVAENMMFILETVSIDGESVRGSNMHYNIEDGILNFFVNYDCFVRKDEDKIPKMENMNTGIKAKG